MANQPNLFLFNSIELKDRDRKSLMCKATVPSMITSSRSKVVAMVDAPWDSHMVKRLRTQIPVVSVLIVTAAHPIAVFLARTNEACSFLLPLHVSGVCWNGWHENLVLNVIS